MMIKVIIFGFICSIIALMVLGYAYIVFENLMLKYFGKEEE